MTCHLRRKHRGVDLKAAQIMPSGIEGSEYGTVAESGQFIDSHVEETLSDPTVMSRQSTKISSPLCALIEGMLPDLSQSALEFAVLQVQQMLTYTVEDMKQSVEECLLPYLQASGIQIVSARNSLCA